MQVFGIKLIGVNAHTGEKLVFTLAIVIAYFLLRFILKEITRLVFARYDQNRLRFWVRQTINLTTTIILFVGLLSIWFDNPRNFATAVGLAGLGLSFALQKVVTAVAGYVVIMRGKTFNVGDRISMGGVRGDVIALDFIQTTIMEMGQPEPVQADAPAMWVYGRQFTGRIVTVSNSKIFDEPLYNYSRDFPLIWEEMRIPVSFSCDLDQAERILIDCAERHTKALRESGEAQIEAMMHRYAMASPDLNAAVFYRITDNWVELGLRFVSPTHGARALKDVMSREILRGFREAGIAIASGTYDIVGLPPLRIVGWPPPAGATGPVTNGAIREDAPQELPGE